MTAAMMAVPARNRTVPERTRAGQATSIFSIVVLRVVGSEKSLTKKTLCQRVDIVLVALFADSDRNDGDQDDIILDLEENPIPLPNRAYAVIAE